MSIEAAKWQRALGQLGFATRTMAGTGPVDRVVPGLAIDADEPPSRSEVVSALDDADLVVVENLCSLPLNPRAATVVADVLAARPAILHHHDLPWQRPQFVDHPPPPVDDRWSQVTINELSRRELAARGITSTTVYNSFAIDDQRSDQHSGRSGLRATGAPRQRQSVRRALGLGDRQRLVLQPTRALPRKNVAGGIGVATQLGGTFWLLGPAEDGFGPELDALVAAAACPIILGTPAGAPDIEIGDAYQACDVVTLPSTWEGFGNPSVESAIHRRPLAIGPYPVADELTAFGFEWFPLDRIDRLGAWLDTPDPGLLDRNVAVAAEHFSLRDLPDRIAGILPEL